jgi:chromate transporter
VSPSQGDAPAGPVGLTLGQAARTWARIGLESFGGPAGQIAVMHKVLVAILALSVLYATFRHLAAVDALFFGLKPAVLAIVVGAVIRIGRRSIKGRVMVAFAAAAFVGIFFFDVPFPLIVAATGVAGILGSRLLPRYFPQPGAAGAGGEEEDGALLDTMLAGGRLRHLQPSLARAVRVTLVCAMLWFAPLAAVALAFGSGSVFVQQGLFFSKAAMVTFGGAYAVLAYVAQQAVTTFDWLRPGEMLDGLGMAETTPGPLILVLQFVGFMGAYRDPGTLPPMVAAVLGATLTVWVTFVPCFLWIFVGAPYIEALRGNRSLHAALSAITAAVVGVILNLSLWFAVHTIFATVGEVRWNGVHLLVPEWGTVSMVSLLIAVGALVATLHFKLSMGWTLGLSAAVGLLWRLLVAGA